MQTHPSRSFRILHCAAFAALAFMTTPLLATDKAGNGVRVSGIGYVPGIHAAATIVGAKDGSFELVDAATGKIAYTGTASAPFRQESTQETVRVADFTDFAKPGTYILRAPGVPDSAPFAISTSAPDRALECVMIGFYGQRCGVPVKFEWNGDTFFHAACHLGPSSLEYYDKSLAGKTKDGTGGWHDAGDYGRYVVNAAFTSALMIQAWERNRENLKDLTIPVPEAKGALPYFLAENKFNLDWILKMQMEDGRVSHKLTGLRFCGMVVPEEDPLPPYFTPASRLATIDFAAVGCMAARAYREFDAAYADQWLAAAKKAWIAQRTMPRDDWGTFANFHTGAYLVPPDSDYKWALIEVRLAFGEKFLTEEELAQYRNAIDDDNRMFITVWDWANGYNFGLYDWLFSNEAKAHPEIFARMKTDLLGSVDPVVTQARSHGYGRGIRVFYWGSNGAVARLSMSLHTAYLLTGEKKYLDTAYDQLAWLFGRNAFSRSFVTGVGLNPPMHPHHRPSEGDRVTAPWPGHLLSGPNPREIDWFDEMKSYSTNENAINWDAALAYGLAIFYKAE